MSPTLVYLRKNSGTSLSLFVLFFLALMSPVDESDSTAVAAWNVVTSNVTGDSLHQIAVASNSNVNGSLLFDDIMNDFENSTDDSAGGDYQGDPLYEGMQFALCWVFMMLCCYFCRAKPPAARFRRGTYFREYARQRRRQEREKKRRVDPKYRQAVIAKSLTVKRIVSVDREGNLTLGEAKADENDCGSAGAGGVSETRSCKSHGQEESVCVICLEEFCVGDVVAWSRHVKKTDNADVETGDDAGETAAELENAGAGGSEAVPGDSPEEANESPVAAAAAAAADESPEGTPADTACFHVFHQECIESWLDGHDDCPSCRKEILLHSQMAAWNRARRRQRRRRRRRRLAADAENAADEVEAAATNDEGTPREEDTTEAEERNSTSSDSDSINTGSDSEGSSDADEEDSDSLDIDDLDGNESYQTGYSSTNGGALFVIMHGLVSRARRASYSLIGQTIDAEGEDDCHYDDLDLDSSVGVGGTGVADMGPDGLSSSAAAWVSPDHPSGASLVAGLSLSSQMDTRAAVSAGLSPYGLRRVLSHGKKLLLRRRRSAHQMYQSCQTSDDDEEFEDADPSGKAGVSAAAQDSSFLSSPLFLRRVLSAGASPLMGGSPQILHRRRRSGDVASMQRAASSTTSPRRASAKLVTPPATPSQQPPLLPTPGNNNASLYTSVPFRRSSSSGLKVRFSDDEKNRSGDESNYDDDEEDELHFVELV